MHIGSHYRLREFLYWTRRDLYKLAPLAALPTVAYQVLALHWLALPWVPIALIGTSAAFIVGFKNTQTYNRLWEARQIWGAIVNGSRSWGILVHDLVQSDPAQQRQLIHRHLAWLTALRYQLRKPQPWENTQKPHNQEYLRRYSVPEWDTPLESELTHYLPADELNTLLERKNRATQLIAAQSRHLAQLRQQGCLGEYEHVEMTRRLSDFYDQQGKAERIKNFPYPRQFASINLFFVRLFVLMLPFGMLNEFQKLGEHFVWLNIPFSMMIGWVFISMERVGEATENPFEGGANDIPITSMSRTIEIDLRDMFGETDLPAPLQAVNQILM